MPVTEERIIAVETSGRKGSVAIAAGPTVLASRTFATNVEHARELLPSVDILAREQGWTPQSITQCYLSIGPGSFTGLRVAVAFARMLAAAGNVRICAKSHGGDRAFVVHHLLDQSLEIRRRHYSVGKDNEVADLSRDFLAFHPSRFERWIEVRSSPRLH